MTEFVAFLVARGILMGLAAVAIAIAAWEFFWLAAEGWPFTISELASRRPGLAVWLAFILGALTGGLIGHIGTLLDTKVR